MHRLPRLSLTRVVIILAAVAVGYFLVSAVSDVLLSHQLSEDERKLQRDVLQLERQHEDLIAIREYLRTDEYIEGVARRILGLVRPGETLVIVNGAEPTPGPSPVPPGEDRQWWEELYLP